MDITTLIGQYAFPIVACIVMAWYVKYMGDMNRDETRELRREHEDEVNKLAEAVNNNTVILNKLLILFSKGDDNE